MEFDSINHISSRSEFVNEDINDHSSVNSEQPSRIFYPKTHEECQQLVIWANQTNASLFTRGAGTGTTGGAICTKGDQIGISLVHMNNILDLDQINATITVEPGVILSRIHQAVEAVGLFYPPDPASLNRCTIGGNVAENAGGPRALKYGVTKDYVIGLKGVWANGESFEYGGKLKKNVAGYDLIGLLTGSEGTLAVITEITLKLRPKPTVIAEAIAGYKSTEDALIALTNTLTRGVLPSTAEFMVERCMSASLAYSNEAPVMASFPAYVIWQVDGQTVEDVNKQLNQIKSFSKGATFLMMDTDDLSNRVWGLRRNVSLGLKQVAKKKYSEDIVVPIGNVPEVIKRLETLNHPSGIEVLGYGHLGDGNIHVNILKMSASEDDWERFSPDVIEQVMAIALKYGGSISGEHGIGVTKKQFMPLMFSNHDLHIMKQIKTIVDPLGILNPGKLHP